jgi:hypothetical protein
VTLNTAFLSGIVSYILTRKINETLLFGTLQLLIFRLGTDINEWEGMRGRRKEKKNSDVQHALTNRRLSY